jgi:hypothetical protein
MDPSLLPTMDSISLTILEEYIEKYPEDVEKWVEHLGPKLNLNNANNDRRLRRRHRDDEPVNTIIPVIESDLDTAPTDHTSVCLKCKRSWTSTIIHPKTTLLCGHSYHTQCFFMMNYADLDVCIHDGCNYSIWAHVREIHDKNVELRRNTTQLLIDTLKGNPEFNKSMKELQEYIKKTRIYTNLFRRNAAIIKRDVIKRHKYNIQALQNDMNNSVKVARKHPRLSEARKMVTKYRRFERAFQDKYHLTLHDLVHNRVIRRPAWDVMHILNRHGSFMPSSYRFGIRIRPGSNKAW